jgi:8-oxo-dGTP pyrophosphatase MutT (NUDIX family)
VKSPVSYELKDICYVLGNCKTRDISGELERRVKYLSVAEYNRFLDQKEFTGLLGKIYHYRPKIMPKVLEGYKTFYEKLKTFPSSGKSFEFGWSFPKGGAESNENRIMVLRREIMQETGLQPSSYTVLPIEPFKFEVQVDGYTFTSWIYFGELDQTVVFPTRGATLAPALREMVTKPTAQDEICDIEFVPLSEVRSFLPTEACDALKLALARFVEYTSKRILSELS